MYKIGDIIEYIDGTRDENFELAQKWAKDNNAEFVELVERREKRMVREKYKDNAVIETPYIVPAKTHEETVAADVKFDENGEVFEVPEHLITVIDEPEHEDIKMEYKIVTKTRDIEQTVRYFEIKKKTEIEPTIEELKARRITDLKSELVATDYVVIKIAEGVATPEEYAEIIAQRQQWRQEINALEAQQ